MTSAESKMFNDGMRENGRLSGMNYFVYDKDNS